MVATPTSAVHSTATDELAVLTASWRRSLAARRASPRTDARPVGRARPSLERLRTHRRISQRVLCPQARQTNPSGQRLGTRRRGNSTCCGYLRLRRKHQRG